MRSKSVIEELTSRADPASRDGMARYGIRPSRALGGTSVPALRAMAKRLGRDHELAGELWASGIHEARLLATMVDDPALVTDDQMNAWASDFDSWDIVDQCCSNLFSRTALAWPKVEQWTRREEEFVKRAGFAMMAALAVHDKRATDENFERCFALIVAQADDDRNYVKKAVNWALRQIGKRNRALNARALEVAEEIRARGTRSAKWIASDAIRELSADSTKVRLTR
jgi:3-methyladenine DNA glycosylase AlkD